MRVGVIVPTRNNRPKLLERCKFYIERQTRKPDAVVFVDYPQTTFPVDLTERYKFGFEALKGKADVVFCIEDDDYYAPDYIETMLYEWAARGVPDIFGIGETWFYHPAAHGYYHKTHPTRSCAFTTMVRMSAAERFDWSTMHPLFFDVHAWRQLGGQTFIPTKQIALGIKHGRGHCGASGHGAWFYSRTKGAKIDTDFSWLVSRIGFDDAQFYIKMAKDAQIV